ncbi:MAG: Xaa-Pro dipeptidyl-peptidase, partial [Planctomycetota bacterium]
MTKDLACRLFLTALVGFASAPTARGEDEDDGADKAEARTVPVFKDGEAQIVDGFKDSDYWIRHDLWVETDFDSDEDGKPDRMHVSVTRPRQTETEGLQLPV